METKAKVVSSLPQVSQSSESSSKDVSPMEPGIESFGYALMFSSLSFSIFFFFNWMMRKKEISDLLSCVLFEF